MKGQTMPDEITQDELKTMIDTQAKEVAKGLVEEAKKQWDIDTANLLAKSNPGVPIAKVKDPTHRLGNIILAYSHSKLTGKSLDDSFKFFGQEIRNFISVDAEAYTKTSGGINISTLADGGALIPEIYAPEILDMLRTTSGFRQGNPRMENLTNGNLTYRKLVSGSTAYWLGEGDAMTKSTPQYGQVNLSVKTLSGQVVMSNKSLRYSGGVLPANLELDLTAVMGTKEDVTLLLSGTGTANTPESLHHLCPTANTNAMTGTPTALTMATDLNTAMKTVLKANLPAPRRLTWFMTEMDKFILSQQIVPTYGAPMSYASELMQKGTIGGYPVVTTNNLLAAAATTSTIILADMNQVILGEGLKMRIEFVDTGGYYDSTTLVDLKSTDQSMLIGLLEEDMTVPNPKAIAEITAVTWGI
jgi:HK97 family phage major capsid protein